MKKFILTLMIHLMSVFVAVDMNAAKQAPRVYGTVTDTESNPLEFATVTIIIDGDGRQYAAGMTDENGEFSLDASSGDYILCVSLFGYKEKSQKIVLKEDLRLGNIVLEADSKTLKELVVVGNRITRQADRFIVNVDGDLSAAGKDAYDLLRTAPGVWISTQNGITINGSGNVKILINNRELKMSGDQLENYLRGIKHNDILKIEVIPASGADMDADSGGGVLNIVLKRRRDDGMNGSIGINGSYGSSDIYSISPNGNINYQSGKLNLYSRLGYMLNNAVNPVFGNTEHSSNAADGSLVRSHSLLISRSKSYSGSLGGVYEIDKRHSIGAEINANLQDINIDNDSHSIMEFAGTGVMGIDSMLTVSRSYAESPTRYYSGTFNYNFKTDDAGSFFKVIGDYIRNDSENPADIRSSISLYSGGIEIGGRADSLNNRTSNTTNEMFSLATDYNKVFKTGTSMKVGAKYSANRMNSNVSARYRFDDNDGAWTDIPSQSLRTNYKENIGALYAIFSSSLGFVSYTVGLRGEYTGIDPQFESAADHSGINKRSYFDLFPNANVMFALNKIRSNSIVLTYSRSIQRPGFWALNPIRVDMDNYTYIVGNPDLRPSYVNKLILTGVYKYRYSLSIGALITRSSINQVVSRDETDPNVIRYRYENTAQSDIYFANLSLPLNINEWWSLTAAATTLYRVEKLAKDTPVSKHLSVSYYASTSFKLPENINLEISYWGMTKMNYSNMYIYPMHSLNVSIKKRFSDDRFTASIAFNNILNSAQKVRSYGDGFIMYSKIKSSHFNVSASLLYNFKSGKKIRSKQVERLSDDGRLKGGEERGTTGIGM